MWVYFPDKDEEKEAWTGTISAPKGPRELWSFELIRHVEFDEMYRTEPFGSQSTVIGLLDYQRQCTLIHPIVLHIEPGSLGVRIPFQRTRISGEFQGMLSDLAIEDINENIFTRIAFDSNTFAAWYSPPAYMRGYDSETKTPYVEVKAPQYSDIDIHDIGHITCTLSANISPGLYSRVIRSSAILQLNFSNLASLKTVINTCYGLERLFGFLIGFRGKFPLFNVWRNKTYKVGDKEFPLEGKLELGGVDWTAGDPPHPIQCIHLNGICDGSLEKILSNFFSDRENILMRIDAVEFSRFFSKNLCERFSVIMPVLEHYMQNKFSYTEEIAFIENKEAFFGWIDNSGTDNFREFARKHLRVIDSKSPSLKTLLLRAISKVNEAGFTFSDDLAERIHKRRGRMFHSSPQIDAGEAQRFYEEVRAATGILMLLTYIDLGINISHLTDRPHALEDFREFLPPPVRPQEIPPAK